MALKLQLYGRMRRFEPGGGNKEAMKMVDWALAFLLAAILAALIGFTGIAAAGEGIAKAMFFLFLMLFMASLIAKIVRRA